MRRRIFALWFGRQEGRTIGAAATQRSIDHDVEEPHVATRRRRGERAEEESDPDPDPDPGGGAAEEEDVNEMKEPFRPKHWRLTKRDLTRVTWTTKYKWEKMKMYHERKVKSVRSETEKERPCWRWRRRGRERPRPRPRPRRWRRQGPCPPRVAGADHRAGGNSGRRQEPLLDEGRWERRGRRRRRPSTF